MRFLAKYHNSPSLEPRSKDYERVEKIDEDGNLYVTYVEVDYDKIRQANGSVKDWSLDALLKAGIDPGFGIHTSNTTRLEAC